MYAVWGVELAHHGTVPPKRERFMPLWYNHVPSLVQNWILAKLKHSFNLFQLHLGCAGKRGVKGMAAVPALRLFLVRECPSPNVQTGHRVPTSPELAESHNQKHRLRTTLMFSSWQRTHQQLKFFSDQNISGATKGQPKTCSSSSWADVLSA